jgi:DNA-damage-inducible protein D
MSNIKLFESKKIRSVWNETDEKWYFVVTDVVQVLTDTSNPIDYLKKVRKRDLELNKGWGQIVTPLSIQTAGGKQKLNCSNAKATFGLTPSEYKKVKGLKNQNLRDHMNDLELIFSMLGEASTTAIVKTKNPKGFVQNKVAAKQGGTIAGNARKELELKTGERLVSEENYLIEGEKAKKLDNGKKGQE